MLIDFEHFCYNGAIAYNSLLISIPQIGNLRMAIRILDMDAKIHSHDALC